MKRAPRIDDAQRKALEKHAHAPAVLRIEPPQCPECKQPSQYFPSSEDFYDGRDFGPVYACLRCDTRCTTHADGTPAGTLAGPELRKARAKLAVLFDPLWNQADRMYAKGANRNHVKRVARDRAYAWLAEQMKIDDAQRCRGHLFDLSQCAAAYSILRAATINDEKIREWAKARESTAQGESVGVSNARAKAVAPGGARGRRHDVSGARQVVSEGRAVRVIRVVRTDEAEEPGRARKTAPAQTGAARRAKTARTPAEKRAAAEAITAADRGRAMPGVTLAGAVKAANRIRDLQVHTRSSTAAAIARAVGKGTPAGAKRVKASAADAAEPKKKSQVQKARDEFSLQLRQHGFTDWVSEHRFFKGDAYEPRQWRFDFAHLKQKIAVEIEGLVVRRIMTTTGPITISTGRHANVSGFREDCRKYATAIVDGWFVLRFEQSMIYNREAIAYVERVIARRMFELGKKVKRTIGKTGAKRK